MERLRRANSREYEAGKSCVELRYGLVERRMSDVATMRISENAVVGPERRYGLTALLRIEFPEYLEEISDKKVWDRVSHERSPVRGALRHMHQSTL
jgi:hypothetical protein